MRADFQIDAQSYTEDSLIKAPKVREKILANGFLNLSYTRDKFQVGMRYEGFFNPLQGIDARYAGNGIPYRYAKYTNDEIEVTVGNYYEQFGTGMLLRTYQEWALGFDNSLDGLRVKATPLNGVQVVGLIGKQRSFFDLGPGIVRGADVDLSLNDLDIFGQDWLGNDARIKIGASFVSRYQSASDPILKLPENVFGYGLRAALYSGDFSLSGEWVYKINDPSQTNSNSYNPGNGLFTTASYSAKGFGITLNFKRIDNMDFRSDRAAFGNNLTLNFLPPLTKQHTYRLLTLYPYATQPTGEIGFQGEVVYTLAKGSDLGGKYGTTITLNYSNVHNLDTALVRTSDTTDRFRYDAKFFAFGKRLLFNDVNLEINRTWSKSFKSTLVLAMQSYDKDVIEGKTGIGMLHPFTAVLEGTLQLTESSALRFEAQHIAVTGDSSNDHGNWAFGLLEYTLNGSWYFTAFDEWNYGNEIEHDRIHYYTGAIAFIRNGTRFSLGYGRQRAGILCVGGVCRTVPAANGFSLSLTSTF